MTNTPPEHAGSPAIGYLFVGYALSTLALTLWLSHTPPSPVHSSAEVAAQSDTPTAEVARPLATPIQSASSAAIVPDKSKEALLQPKPVVITEVKAASSDHNTRPNFASIRDVKTKKETFFQYLLPAIEAENQRMLNAQARLNNLQKALKQGDKISATDTQQLQDWAELYRIKTTLEPAEIIAGLLPRMDAIPASMVLAQGAMESAWGTSRFARLANNYFGQWCFSKGCGLVPSQRNAGADHEVAKFAHVDGAVTSYFENINRHRAYQRVRDERAALRQAQLPLDSLKMVRGLDKYSARGHAYIEELQSMIRYNKIKRFDDKI